MKKYFDIKTLEFFGGYYDNPNKIKNRNKMRMTIGAIIKPGEDELKGELMLTENTDYKCADLPKILAIKTSFSYKNLFSYMIGAQKAYPVMHSLFSAKKKEN